MGAGKIKLRTVVFPDGSMVVETQKPIKRFSDCTGLLISNGFSKDIFEGNVYRFVSEFATAFVIAGLRTHPYSDPSKRQYSISIYPSAK